MSDEEKSTSQSETDGWVGNNEEIDHPLQYQETEKKGSLETITSAISSVTTEISEKPSITSTTASVKNEVNGDPSRSSTLVTIEEKDELCNKSISQKSFANRSKETSFNKMVASEKSLLRSKSDLTSSTFTSFRRRSSRKHSMKRVSMDAQNTLDRMTNAALVKAVEDLKKNAKHLELENTVFLHFLKDNDPEFIEGMDENLNSTQTMKNRGSCAKRVTMTSLKSDSPFFSFSASSFISGEGREGARINITQKTDLILREKEQIQVASKILTKKYHVTKHKLKAELEEMSIRDAEIREIMNTFDGVFISGTLEKYSQKNPADKYARFIEECFKQARTNVDKLRLRTSSLKTQYQKVCHQLIQKKLIGEKLQEVDFDQLHIENKHLQKKIEQRNLLLLEMKKMSGKANLALSQHKKMVLRKMAEIKAFKDAIAFHEDLVQKLDQEAEEVAEELEKTKIEYDKIKTKTENFKVPAVIEYVRAKGDICSLKKNLKIWTRRRHIKEMALNTCVHEMKSMTGETIPQVSWFEDPQFTHEGRGSIEDNFDFVFRRKEMATLIAKRQKYKSSKKIVNLM